MNIIAEIGLNHLGSVEKAMEIIDLLLVEPEVDGITLQIREDEFYDSTAPHKNKLPWSLYRAASKKIRCSGKLFGVAIADINAIDELQHIGIDFWKTLSWDIQNGLLLRKLKSTNKKIYVSTGISSTEEIIKCNGIWEDVVFIHTSLTLNVDEVHLSAMLNMKNNHGIEMAFGLHSDFKEALYIASSLQPSDVFFYVKGSSDVPDDKHAFLLTELADACSKVRLSEKVMGLKYKNAILTPDWVDKK